MNMSRTRVLVIAFVLFASALVPVIAMQIEAENEKGDYLVMGLKGSPTDIWTQYGKEAKAAIQENLGIFWEFVSSEQLDKDDIIASALVSAGSSPSDFLQHILLVANAADVPYEELLAMNLLGRSIEKPECTNFIAAGSGTVDGEVIASKNRDLNKVQVLMFVEPDNGYSFIGMMSAGEVGVSQAINEAGLSTGHTWMPVPEYCDSGYTPFVINQMMMEQCANVDETIVLLESVPKYEGATYMVADKDKAAFVETVPSIYEPEIVAQVIENGVTYHTNHYVCEPFYSWVIEDGFGYMWTPSIARYDRAAELVSEVNYAVSFEMIMSFDRDIENFGLSDPWEIKNAHPEIPDECWSEGWPGFSICNARTVSSSVFVMDKDYPELMSVLWMAIYNPCWCPYVPLHNAMLKDIDTAAGEMKYFMDGTAWQVASKLRSNDDYDWGDLVPVFEDWESDMQTNVTAYEADAIALVAGGAVDDASELLTQRDCSIASDSIDLMTGLGSWMTGNSSDKAPGNGLRS